MQQELCQSARKEVRAIRGCWDKPVLVWLGGPEGGVQSLGPPGVRVGLGLGLDLRGRRRALAFRGSFGLEKTPKIFQSKNSPGAAGPFTHPCPQVPHLLEKVGKEVLLVVLFRVVKMILFMAFFPGLYLY